MKNQFIYTRFKLVVAIIFEVLFLYPVIRGFVKNGLPENHFLWLTFVLEIGLGYLAYRLFISDIEKYKNMGVALVLFVIAATIIVFVINRDYYSTTIGGIQPFLAATNTFLLYRYWRYPETKSKISDFYKTGFYIFLVISSVFTFWREFGFFIIVVMFFWIYFCRDKIGTILFFRD
jgi:hypothetical protein